MIIFQCDLCGAQSEGKDNLRNIRLSVRGYMSETREMQLCPPCLEKVRGIMSREIDRADREISEQVDALIKENVMETLSEYHKKE